MTLRTMLASIVCVVMLNATAPLGFAAVPGINRLDFTVTREGKVVGHDVIEFDRAGSTLRVKVQTEVAVKVAFITVYRFTHQSEEIWRDDRLESLSSHTDDDGTPHELVVHAEAAKLEIDGDKKHSVASVDIIPASLWNVGIVKSHAILNTLDGSQMTVQVRDLGTESIEAWGQRVQARHYVLTGDLERELWYDATDVLMQVRLKGKDGSEVFYALR